jgi:acetyl esterase/lipase
MNSIKSKTIEFFLGAINFKSIIKRMALNPSRTKKQFVPSEFTKSFTVKTQIINSRTIATIEKNNSSPKIHIIYLHGGAYVFESSSLHWSLLKKILNKISSRISIVDYPLAPENNYKNTFEMLSKAYEYIIGQYSKDEIIIMGDSAGGGLALAFIQKLIRENELTIPSKLILLSPWIDLTLENPEIKLVENLDKQLSIGFLKYCADKYSDGDDKHNYLLSPINGSIKGLPRTVVFYGTHELFCPDIKKLKKMAIEENVKIQFVEYDEMQHDWILFPISESDNAISEIHDFIMN